ncbi:MAG: hypothetical protein AB2A00_01320 [Myxococcota bacterium]
MNLCSLVTILLAATVAPAETNTQSTPTVTSSPAAVVVPALPVPERPRLEFGDAGYLELSAVMNAWVVGSGRWTFRLRRAELYASGRVVKHLGFNLMLDPARVLELVPTSVRVLNQDPGASVFYRSERVLVLQPPGKVSMLQDMVLVLTAIPYMNLAIGQGRIPMSNEATTSSRNLLFAERWELARVFSDWRDVGAWASYRFKYLAYHVGLYNGAGANALDDDVNKDFAARLELLVPLVGLKVGTSLLRTLPGHDAWIGQQQHRLGQLMDVMTRAPGPESAQRLRRAAVVWLPGDDPGARTALGADITLELGGVRASAEAYQLRLLTRESVPQVILPRGAAVSVGYTVGRLFVADWQPAWRLEWYDADWLFEGDELLRSTVGSNFMFAGNHAKLQLNWMHSMTASFNADGQLFPVNDDAFVVSVQGAL